MEARWVNRPRVGSLWNAEGLGAKCPGAPPCLAQHLMGDQLLSLTVCLEGSLQETGFLKEEARAGLSGRFASTTLWRCAADSQRTLSCTASSVALRSQRSSLPNTTTCVWSSSLTILCPKRASRPTSSQVTLDSLVSNPISHPKRGLPCPPWSPSPASCLPNLSSSIRSAPGASGYLYWEALKTLVVPGLGRGRAF